MKTLNIINDFIKTSESETEKNMLNIIKNTLISEILKKFLRQVG